MKLPVALALAALALGACSLLNAPDDVKPDVAGVGGDSPTVSSSASGKTTSSSQGTGGGNPKGVCGDGKVDPGETCDPVGSCPSSCPARVMCTDHKLVGDASKCTAKCEDTPYVVCSGDTKDGCCPKGVCNGANDVDCAACGNGIVDFGELCDDGMGGGGGGAGGGTGGAGTGGAGGGELGMHVPCPVTCDDADACTTDTMSGSSATCDVQCAHAPIVACASGDGCCPGGCTIQNDSDCCGNDCFGTTGCLTPGGKCIRLACRDAITGENFCASCLGPQWKDITRTDWLNGYCQDITAVYRANVGYLTMCGAPGLACCGDEASCMGGDNAWHFYDPVSKTVHYMGPVLGEMGADGMNCTYWDDVQSTTYSRLSVCQHQ